MEELGALAARHGLKIVEDNSHGPLSRWRGRALGTIGDAGCFSFFGNKNMTTGEGGMVVTADPAAAARLRLMRSHGMTSNTYARYRGHAFGYDVVALGWNYRMDEMRAAMGLAQLAKLPGFNRDRQRLVEYYRAALARALPQVRVPFLGFTGDDYAYHILPVLLPPGCEREAVMARLTQRGVQTSVHYRPIHGMTDFGGGEALALPVTDALAPRILTLPLYPTLSLEQIDLVVGSLAACL
jgi:dTDP-4-amino-4,6-dideoxygalactose transaminase